MAEKTFSHLFVHVFVSHLGLELWVFIIFVVVPPIRITHSYQFFILQERRFLNYTVKYHHAPFSQLRVSRVLFGIDGLVIRATAALQEAQARIGTHGGVHLIAWVTEADHIHVNKGVYTYPNYIRGTGLGTQSQSLSHTHTHTQTHTPCLNTPMRRERSASESHQPDGYSCCSISGIQMSMSLKTDTGVSSVSA